MLSEWRKLLATLRAEDWTDLGGIKGNIILFIYISKLTFPRLQAWCSRRSTKYLVKHTIKINTHSPPSSSAFSQIHPQWTWLNTDCKSAPEGLREPSGWDRKSWPGGLLRHREAPCSFPEPQNACRKLLKNTSSFPTEGAILNCARTAQARGPALYSTQVRTVLEPSQRQLLRWACSDPMGLLYSRGRSDQAVRPAS